MWLLLCTDDDVSAFWAGKGLAARGLLPFLCLTGTMLSAATHWEHRVAETGEAFTRFRLPDGREVDTREVRGTLNRLHYLPMNWSARVVPADREYAGSELFAFFVSWLHALPPPIVNPPTPQFLAGALLSRPCWIVQAAKAGLPVAAYQEMQAANALPGSIFYNHQKLPDTATECFGSLIPEGSGVQTLYVIGNQIVVQPGMKMPPTEVQNGCLRLAEQVGASLLGIDFVQGVSKQALEPDWIFAGASATPDMYTGGEALLDALAAVLTEPTAGRLGGVRS